MPDPIRDALRAAALATMTAAEREHSAACHNGQPGPGHIKRAAETVVAFLSALPHGARVPDRDDPEDPGWSWEHWISRDLAAAVERAARDECPPPPISAATISAPSTSQPSRISSGITGTLPG